MLNNVFWKKTCKKRWETKQVSNIIEFYPPEIVWIPNFSQNWQFWVFGPNQLKKGISNKQKTMKITIEFCIFELVQVLYSNFSKFNILEQSSQKRILPIENRKTEHHHRVFHIRISLNTKFQLKLTLLTFWTNLFKTGISSLKR